MTKKQREDISKLLYDLIKLTYTGFIIGSVISPKGLNILHVIHGISLSSRRLLTVVRKWIKDKGISRGGIFFLVWFTGAEIIRGFHEPTHFHFWEFEFFWLCGLFVAWFLIPDGDE